MNTNGNAFFPAHERLVSRRLADAGYACGLVGKLHLAGAANGREPRGHDYADWLRRNGHDPSAVLAVNSTGLGGLIEPTPNRDNGPPALHQTTWCSEQAIEFISQEHAQPWFLSVNPYDPRPPYNPPWEFYRRFHPAMLPGPHFADTDLAHQAKLASVDFHSVSRRPEQFEAKKIQAAYYAMVEQVDEQFGRLVDALEHTGQRENTVIVFMSDHGEALGDHGLIHKGCRFFEGLVRVPLIVSWPGHFPAGLRSDALIELIDIAPT